MYMNTFNKVVTGIVMVSLVAGAFAVSAKEQGVKGALDAVTLACVQTAIDGRDNAIIAGLDAYYPAAKTALQTRQATLKAAWTKFEADRKACNPKAAGDDKESLGIDSQL